MQMWQEQYQAIDNNFSHILEQNLPYFSYGRGSKLAILIHGFMGSPDEMSEIGSILNDRNIHVYNTLIPGFGGTAKIANQYSHQSWTAWLDKEISRAMLCADEIYLIGFSTGGLLIHDWLAKNPNHPKIKAASLVAPYFQTSGFFNSIIQHTASKFLSEISVYTVHAIPWFKDVEIMTIRTEEYLQSVPLRTTAQIVELGQINKRHQILGGQIRTPAQVLISNQDQVTAPDAAVELVQSNFRNLQLVEYGQTPEGRSPHHLMCEEVSPVAKDLEARILDFILSNK